LLLFVGWLLCASVGIHFDLLSLFCGVVVVWFFLFF